jgi:hypothetical protein
MKTTLKTTVTELKNNLKVSEILYISSNYLQCIINDKFCEFQKNYNFNCWVQFETFGNSNCPNERILKILN